MLYFLHLWNSRPLEMSDLSFLWKLQKTQMIIVWQLQHLVFLFFRLTGQQKVGHFAMFFMVQIIMM